MILQRILKRNTISWKTRYVLRILQHLFIGIVMAMMFFLIVGSSFTGSDGTEYRVYDHDYGMSYENSELFNEILKNNLEDVATLTAISTLLETDGEYDSNKTVDVTAFVNRNSILQSDYITAVYEISDLIKWSQNGFEYDEKTFTASDSTNFLGKSTVYTHLMKNNAEGGMNSFLNSQLDNNIVRTNVGLDQLYDGAGTHTILVPRYKTVHDENIQDIVSTWDAYNSLCANITEAASTMAVNYDSYIENKKKYGFYKSNIRYYITRTINARTEVYTNVESLKRSTNGINIADTFKSYGKYIYYCPYEIEYGTNTNISEEDMRAILGDYRYAFPDQMKFYLAVDTGNLSRIDDFSLGKEAFNRYMPYYKQVYTLIAIFIILYILAILQIASYENYIVYPSGKVGGLENVDVIPIEVVLLISAVGVVGIGALYAFIVNNYINFAMDVYLKGLVIFVLVFLIDNFLSFSLYCIIRRWKNKALYKTSLVSKIGNAVKKVFDKLTIKQNILIRTMVPYIFSVIANFLLLTRFGIVGLIIAAILNLGVGIYVINLCLDKVMIMEGLQRIVSGDIETKIESPKLHGANVYFAEELNSIADAVQVAVNRSMRDEKLKADLITNVSHDIKTPLTSIINYVDLLKRENIEDARVRSYISILESKAQRLRQLTDDLVEASKISSGNITLHMEEINYAEIVNQILGEFYEKFDDYELMPILKCGKYAVTISADPRQLYRVIENLLNNVCKYALPGTRVYMDLEVNESEGGGEAVFSIKNISRNELNIDADELTERFIRGDISRSTEGSGLGLSIAKNLTVAMGGKFEIILDGDLFKVNVSFAAKHYSDGNPSAETSDVL